MNVSGAGASQPAQPVSCPVPPEQRPLREYSQLVESWFFAWAAAGGPTLLRALVISWAMAMPPSLLVASGSLPLRHHPLQLAIASSTAAMAVPLLLLARQWLGWSYVHRRLVAERVDYEESGWYDGQVWAKPLSWRQQDLLVARHQVQPILAIIRRGSTTVLLLLAAGIAVYGVLGVCQAL